MRRARILSREERQLWQAVVADVTPRGPPVPEPSPEKGDLPAEVPLDRTAPPPPSRPSRRRVAAAPPLQALEKPLLRALQKGRRRADAVIDLHGMRQDAAHAALTRFLVEQQRAGASVVAVITGKGASSGAAGDWEGDRGVLRRQVPHWLRLPDLRSLVLGFQSAGPRQGGEGALYVRLRRLGRS